MLRVGLGLLLLGMACGCGGESDRSGALVVFAAASTADVVESLAADFDGAPVKTSFGASSQLARQIEDGAPADVYVSASRAWIDHVREAGALSGEPVVFARGALVCVAPEDSGLAVDDLTGLQAGLAARDRVAVADEGVPAGDYARQALRSLGALQGLRPHLVGQKDVRAVVRAVERGDCAAGFAYATDARAAAVRVLFTLPAASHDPIEYFVAAVGDRPAEAARLVAWLTGEQARAVLQKHGFLAP